MKDYFTLYIIQDLIGYCEVEGDLSKKDVSKIKTNFVTVVAHEGINGYLDCLQDQKFIGKYFFSPNQSVKNEKELNEVEEIFNEMVPEHKKFPDYIRKKLLSKIPILDKEKERKRFEKEGLPEDEIEFDLVELENEYSALDLYVGVGQILNKKKFEEIKQNFCKRNHLEIILYEQ